MLKTQIDEEEPELPLKTASQNCFWTSESSPQNPVFIGECSRVRHSTCLSSNVSSINSASTSLQHYLQYLRLTKFCLIFREEIRFGQQRLAHDAEWFVNGLTSDHSPSPRDSDWDNLQGFAAGPVRCLIGATLLLMGWKFPCGRSWAPPAGMANHVSNIAICMSRNVFCHEEHQRFLKDIDIRHKSISNNKGK